MNHVKILFAQLLSLILFFPSIFLAQAPESMNYQAVIRDGSGDLVDSQQVGLRIKILQGSATGSSVYEETYSPVTNAYGLVNLQLGTGTVQSGTFSSIDWGNGPYFVETAADVSGGTSYVTLSTTQFMSVPYALYAKNAGLDSAAVQAMIDAAVGSGGGGSEGKSFAFPEGLNGTPITYAISSGNYTVPTGKRLYILNLQGGTSHTLNVNGFTVSYYATNSTTDKTLGLPIILSAGDVLSGTDAVFNGFLVNSNANLTTVTHRLLGNSNYTVPAGKMLYILNVKGGTSHNLYIDGTRVNNYLTNSTSGKTLNLPLIASAGDVITGADGVFNGYVVDEDFFESSSSGTGSSGGGGDLPIGTIIPFAGSQIPSGWLLCDGSSVSRSTYSNLYTALGNTWGSSSSTTFNLPDLRGRFLRGVDSGSGNDPDASSRTAINSGGNTGDNVGSYQNDEFKSHNHGISTSSGSGTNSVMRGGGINSGSSTSYRGGNETRPKNAYVNYIIKY